MERGSGQNRCFDTLSTFDPMFDVDHRSLMSTIDVRHRKTQGYSTVLHALRAYPQPHSD